MCDFYNKEPMWMPEEMNKAYQLGRYGENNLVCTYIGYHGNAGLPLFKRHEDAMSALRKLTDEERIVVWGTKEIEL